MTVRTEEVVRLCEQLPEAEQAEVAAFARSLLTRHAAGKSDDVFDRWLSQALGAATTGMTTAQSMELTRGEP